MGCLGCVSRCFHAGDRRRERPEVQQMLDENSEGLGLKVITVMVQRYGVLPKEMWDLNSILDMGAGRGVIFDGRCSEAMRESILSNNRYSIFNLTLGHGGSPEVPPLPNTLRRLVINAEYQCLLALPANLQELVFECNCIYNQPLTLPPRLSELQLGSEYSQLLILPQQLKRLAFAWNSRYNLPLALPLSLTTILFGISYNQPTTLPSQLEDLEVGRDFAHDLSLPASLRKIKWWCNHGIQIPEGVAEAEFCGLFNQPVTFPSTLKKLTFSMVTYTHPLSFPTGLEELDWSPSQFGDLVLHDGLQKLTWRSPRSNVRLPWGLKELVLRGNTHTPLVLPDGLVKVTFDNVSEGHYFLPESVQEVTWSRRCSDRTCFTHPTTLPHLILGESSDNFILNFSNKRVHKLTIADRLVRIKPSPPGVKELAFTVDSMRYALLVPGGCRIVGEKRPRNVFLTDIDWVRARNV